MDRKKALKLFTKIERKAPRLKTGDISEHYIFFC